MAGSKRNPDMCVDDLQSEFDYQSEVERKKKRTDFLQRERPGEAPKPGRGEGKHWFQEEHGRMHRQMAKLMTLDAYSRHKEMINLYHLSHQGSTSLLKRDTSKDRTDYDVLKDNHKFVWSLEDESEAGTSWEARFAKKYYDKLYKEYCIVDLTYYLQNKIAMRWRVEKEVKSGKGQFICGSKKCNSTSDLTSWEVNFAYVENGAQKNTLVKVRLCPPCSDLLNYKTHKKKVVKRRRGVPKLVSKLNNKEGKKYADDYISVGGGSKDDGGGSTSVVTDVWEKPAAVETERTVDEDIDDYLDQLFD